MIKVFLTVATCALWTCQLWAAEKVTDYEQYKSNPRAYYASHPAAKYAGEPILNKIAAELIVQFGSCLDRSSVGAYFRSCRMINANRMAVSVLFLPELYRLQKLDIQNAFFQLDHPQWTPDKLSPAERWKLHYSWFLTGWKIPIPFWNNWTPAQKLVVREKVGFLYSAASCAHQLAAEEVGRLLLDPRLNQAIPIVFDLFDLPRGLKQMDARRLHREPTKNPELAKFMQLLESLYPDSDSDEEDEKPYDEKLRSGDIAKCKRLLDEINKIAETPEVKVFKVHFTSFLAHLSRGGNPDDYTPNEAINLARKMHLNTPLIRSFLYNEETTETPPNISLVGKRTNYLSFLNPTLISEYVEALEPEVCTRTARRNAPNSFNVTYHTTEQARQTMRLIIQMQRVGILIGDQHNTSLKSMRYCIEPANYEIASKEILPKEDRIHMFLYFLLLSRNPTPNMFNQIKTQLELLLCPPHLTATQHPNADRYKALVQKFQARRVAA